MTSLERGTPFWSSSAKYLSVLSVFSLGYPTHLLHTAKLWPCGAREGLGGGPGGGEGGSLRDILGYVEVALVSSRGFEA